MAFIPGLNSRYFVGYERLSVMGKSLSFDATAAQLDVSSFEDRAQVFINGIRTGSASFDMMLDTSTTAPAQFTLLNTWQGTPQPITIGLDGVALDAIVDLMLGNQSSVSYGSQVGDLVMTNVSVQVDGQVERGRVLSAEQAITTTTNGASQNNIVPTTNGAVFHLHVTGFTGITSDVITIEDSADNSAWSTIATFSTVTGVTSERLAITGTVRQYIRVVDTVTGSGSCTRMVARVRR